MSELIRIKNIDQYSQEYVNGELVLTLKKTTTAVVPPPVQNISPITILDVFDKGLTSLPELPDSLQQLYCYRNELTSLPEKLPDSLKELYCFSNKLTSLPEKLPDSLQILICDNNKITSLPEKLPDSLQTLSCSNNKLTSLPDLPNSLTCINLTNNPLETNYPKIFTFKLSQAKEIITYVNTRNREMRTDAKTQLTAIKQLIAKFEKTTAT